MNKNKQIEIIRERNAELNQQLNDLRNQLKNQDNINPEEVDDLVAELGSLRNQWQESLDKLRAYESQYLDLISQLKRAKQELSVIAMDYTLPLHQKIFLKIEKAFNKNTKNNKKN